MARDDYDDGDEIYVIRGRSAGNFLDRMFGGPAADEPDDDQPDDDQPDDDQPPPRKGRRPARRRDDDDEDLDDEPDPAPKDRGHGYFRPVRSRRG